MTTSNTKKPTPCEKVILDRLESGPLLTAHVGGRAGAYDAKAMHRLHKAGKVRLETINGRAMWTLITVGKLSPER